MTSKSRASAGISRRQAYQFSGQPCTSSSGGPSPPMTACWRSPPAFTYRLVNVSVNPSGRFGAPETEPGPSGVGRWVEDELTTISFHETRSASEATRTRLGAPRRTAGALPRPGSGHLVDLVEVDQVGVGLLCPAARGLILLAEKDARGHRDGDSL